VLQEQARSVLGGSTSEVSDLDAAIELAQSCEAIVADSSVASDLYRWAYARRPESAWAERAIELALGACDFSRVAAVAELQWDHSSSIDCLKAQAMALIDAGEASTALPLVQRLLRKNSVDVALGALERSLAGDHQESASAIRALEAQALGCETARGQAEFLLQAARIARLWPECEDAEPLLMRAFDADPSFERVYVLLEFLWVESRQWERLGNLYRLRTQRASSPQEEAEAYRRSATTLILRSESPGTGVRLMQQAIACIYKNELEQVPQFVAMLALLSERLVSAGGAPSAIRLLAQGLAHPRSDDEAMWIVNRGLALAVGDDTLRRTVLTFECLRQNLLANEPALLEDAAAAEIGGEVEVRYRPPTVDAGVAERAFVTADVNIAVRAELSTSQGTAFAMTRDVSETGLFFATEARLAIGETVELSILLPGEDDWSLTKHELRGVVARVDEGVGYGVQFSEVPEQFLCDIRALCP